MNLCEILKAILQALSDINQIKGNEENSNNSISKYIIDKEEIINVSEKINTEEMWNEVFSDYDYNNYPGCLAEIVYDLYEYDGVGFDSSVFYFDENINPEGEKVLVRITEIDNQGMDYSVFYIEGDNIYVYNRAGDIDAQYTYDPNLRFQIFIDAPGSITQNWKLVDYLTGKINDYDTLAKSSSFAYSYQTDYRFSSGGDIIIAYGLFFYITNYSSDWNEITLSAFDISEQGPRAQIILRSSFYYGGWFNSWDKPKVIDMRQSI